MRNAFALVAAGCMAMSASEQASAQSCVKADFEAVVDQASSELNSLNQKNKPLFQDKLRQLKDKRGWSHDQFMAEAAPLVRDDRIAEWDQQSAEYLDRINSSGRDGSGQRSPDCALLADIRSTMKALVEAQTAKWLYMFGKIETELTK